MALEREAAMIWRKNTVALRGKSVALGFNVDFVDMAICCFALLPGEHLKWAEGQ